MAKRDFHDTPFDEGTILKLDILAKYLEEWLPVFTYHPKISKINIFDFQCGPGQDILGTRGSPLRITDVIALARSAPDTTPTDIVLHFNDKEQAKIDQLKDLMESKAVVARTVYSSLDFEDCFRGYLAEMQRSGVANFLFIDPTGLVRMEDTVAHLAKLNFTDFLMFVPVQHVRRFVQQNEFQKFMPGLKCNGALEDTPREICAYIQGRLTARQTNYFLAHFSIRKQSSQNVHSLIFGSKNPLGLDKFLNVVWAISPNGEANFEMTGDLLFSTRQLKLPGIKEISTRQEAFQGELRAKVLSGELSCARDVALFSYRRAFLPTKHAKPVLRSMKRDGFILSVPPLGCDVIFKEKRNEPLVLLRASGIKNGCTK